MSEENEKEEKRIESGGSVWGSNPPKTLCMPPDGFEVREAHRDLDAPVHQASHLPHPVLFSSVGLSLPI
jgi:hypothetical protein